MVMARPAVAYLSTPRHVEERWLPLWITRIRSFCLSQGLHLTGVYVDNWPDLTSALDRYVTQYVITPSAEHLERAGASPLALWQRGVRLVEVEDSGPPHP